MTSLGMRRTGMAAQERAAPETEALGKVAPGDGGSGGGGWGGDGGGGGGGDGGGSGG